MDHRILKAACEIAYGDERAEPLMQKWGLSQVASVTEGIDSAVMLSHAEGEILAFRGTIAFDDRTKPFVERLEDWGNDFHAELVEFDNLPGRVHEGFNRSVNTIQEWMFDMVGNGNHLDTVITGHSKGGAMAFIAAAKLAMCHNIHADAVVTWGAAKPGDQEFSKSYNSLGIPTTCYEAEGDIVPFLPPTNRFAMMLPESIRPREYASVGTCEFVHANGVIDPEPSADSHLYQLAAVSRLLHDGELSKIREAHSIREGSIYDRGLQNAQA